MAASSSLIIMHGLTIGSLSQILVSPSSSSSIFSLLSTMTHLLILLLSFPILLFLFLSHSKPCLFLLQIKFMLHGFGCIMEYKEGDCTSIGGGCNSAENLDFLGLFAFAWDFSFPWDLRIVSDSGLMGGLNWICWFDEDGIWEIIKGVYLMKMGFGRLWKV